VLFTSAGRKALQHGNLELLDQHLGRLSQGALQALKEMRLLLYELRPSEYLQDGLVAALQRRLDAVENRTGMDVQFKVTGILPPLDEAEEVALYRIAEEALNNTLKHSNAHQVSVELHLSGEQVELVVSDNGCGFDPVQKTAAGGIGLSSMRERAAAVGGSIEIRSSPGEGTHIIARIGSPT
jgi:signal transduction histidine kinase